MEHYGPYICTSKQKIGEKAKKIEKTSLNSKQPVQISLIIGNQTVYDKVTSDQHQPIQTKKNIVKTIWRYVYKKFVCIMSLPANAISGRTGGGNDDEILAAAKNSNLFLNTCNILKKSNYIINGGVHK